MTSQPTQDDAPATAPEAPPPRPPAIPRPPSQADIDRVSEAQGLITDEWAGAEPAAPRR